MSTGETITDVIKHMPSVTLNDRDDSQMNPNQSDLMLHGDNNTVNVSAAANLQQRKNVSSALMLLLMILSNLIGTTFIFVLHQYYSDNIEGYNKIVHSEIQRDANKYTDDKIFIALNEIKQQIITSSAASLNEAMIKAQEGNRNIIRLQLLRDFDMYLIDGVNSIKQRDLDGLRDMYQYYLSIGGNHDIPPRKYQFEQMISKKQITIIN